MNWFEAVSGFESVVGFEAVLCSDSDVKLVLCVKADAEVAIGFVGLGYDVPEPRE